MGRTKKTLLRIGFWHSIEQHMGFPASSSHLYVPEPQLTTIIVFSWGILHSQWTVEMYGVRSGLKMTEILFIKQVPGLLNIMHYTKLHNILHMKISQNVNSIYVEKHWFRYL